MPQHKQFTITSWRAVKQYNYHMIIRYRLVSFWSLLFCGFYFAWKNVSWENK